MSSRVLRRLREEKEAALADEVVEDGNDESSDEEEEEDDNAGGGGKKAFLMMLEEESSSEEESSESEDEVDEDDKAGDDGNVQDGEKASNNNNAEKASLSNSKKGKKETKKEEEEEDLDAILSDMNIQSSDHPTDADASDSSLTLTTVRSLLLSKRKGFDVQDLDLDYAMRSLLGGAAAGGGGGGVDDIMGGGGEQPQQGRRQRGGGGQNQRGRRTLAKKYLFGKPRNEWGKPPSYVGGGIGMKELTKETLAEERHSWSVPWPYNLNDDDGGDDNNNTNHGIPTIPSSDQKWYTLTMADTYQEQNYMYQEMLSSRNSSSQHRQQAGLHDPNSLAMFVADHPYFAETVLQLAMVLYYINDRGKGNDLLRRCMFLYEAALPSNVLPSNDNENNSSTNSNSSEILIDIDRQPNSGLFATLFRIMQTSGMTGCHSNALATGRYLLSLDPLRDPMGVLLILDYYALASRRTSLSYVEGEEVELGAAFIVDLVESGRIKIHYKDPLTDRHHWCRLVDMPNWSYSYALALYRLSLNEEDDEEERYAERAEVALVQALTRFPMVLPKLLAMNKVNTEDRSMRMDWPSMLPHFSGDAMEGGGVNDTVEERVTRASGEHLVRIYVERCHKLWKEDDVVQLLYRIAEKVVWQHLRSSAEDKVDGEESEQTSPPGEAQDAAAATPANDSKSISALTSTFSPAIARYAQCDPSEYEDAFRTFPPEAIALDPNIVAPAMALGPNRRGRFLRRGQQQQQQRHGGDGGAGGQHDPLEIVRQMLGMGGNNDGVGQGVEVLDPDSPLLQLYLQSLLPWAQVEGVRPPPRG